jgi:hypothetical protein
LSTWMREHQEGVTTMVAKVSGRVYVAYSTDRTGLLSVRGDDERLAIAQASADRSAGCPQPCACPP